MINNTLKTLCNDYGYDYDGFLRVRGGVSTKILCACERTQFSPRTRRCFRIRVLLLVSMAVFSAYAEVFLYKTEKFFL